MDPATTATDPISRPKPNGILTRNHHHHPIIRHHHPPPPPSLYRECLKNHAASLGGHALDGCGEYMPSPSSNPSDPSSLTCAACGCHCNFHRRALLYDDDDDGAEDSGGVGATSQNDDTDGGGGGEVDRRLRSTSPPPPSAPHMLLALSTGGGGISPAAAAGPAAGGATTPTLVGVGGILPRKRFRSKFSPEQKDRMQERLGWRMQKRDEGIIEETCREIGVGKGLFKVWMHNNKHNFVLQNNNSNASSSNVTDSTNASARLGLGGESHVHHNNGVNGSADSSS